LRWLPSLSVRLTKFVNMIRKIEKSYRTFSPSLPLPSFGTFGARLQDAPDTAAMDAPQAGSEQPSKEKCEMEKSPTPADIPLLLTGLITSFLVAFLTMKTFLRFVKSHTFIPFGVYRIVLAAMYFWVFF
jgi:hypothetical protein